MLTSRALNIVYDIINDNEDSSLSTLSHKYKISERMVRYDLDKINDFFSVRNLPLCILQNNIIISTNTLTLKTYLENNHIPQQYTTDERSVLLILSLLFDTNVSIVSFCHTYNISKIMANRSLQQSTDLLQQFSLVLCTDSMTISGTEEQIRHLLLYIIQKYVLPNQEMELIDIIKTYIFPTETLVDLEQLLFQISKKINKILSDDSLLFITNYLKLSLKRIDQEQKILHINDSELLKNSIEYNIIHHEISERKLEQIFSGYEVLKLVDLIIGAQAHNLYKPFFDTWVHQYHIINEFIKYVGTELDCPQMLSDQLLFDSLLNHLKPAIHRLIYHHDLEDPLVEEVTQEFFDIYEVVEIGVKKIERIFNVEFTHAEISFISIYFKITLDRHSPTSVKKKILLVCSSGFGTSALLSQQILSHYNVDILGLCPLYQLPLALEEYNDIEYIVTTLDIEEINIPIIKVGIVLSKDDLRAFDENGFEHISPPRYKLSELLQLYENPDLLVIRLKEYFGEYLIDDIISENDRLDTMLQKHFIIKQHVHTWEEAVILGGEILEKAHYTTVQYTNSLVQNMTDYMTTAHGLAIPHAISNNNVYKTGFSILILDHPVIFPNNKSVSFILTIASQDHENHKKNFMTLFNILNKPSCQKFLKSASIDNIYHYLLHSK